MFWSQVIHIGDLPLTMAAAAALAVWMLLAGAWRMAFWWCLLFALAISLVAASKIAFLVWGGAPPRFNFRALSGHAAGATAIAVMLLHVLLRARTRSERHAGIGAGLLAGAMMGILLVLHDEHSIAEATAGWAVGALAGAGAIRLGGESPSSASPTALACASVVFVSCLVLLRPLPIGYLMWRAAKLVARHASALAMAGF
ncbi:MAG: rane-associated phospholipid phosphatase [Massilia sp.]|nr:rane-associated phospholipid phosphatase [Massilia sp.]